MKENKLEVFIISIFLTVISAIIALYTVSYGYHKILQYYFNDLPNLNYLMIYGILSFKSYLFNSSNNNMFLMEWNTKNKIEKVARKAKYLSIITSLITLLSFYIQTLFQ